MRCTGGSPRLKAPNGEPLIFAGDGKPDEGYTYVQEFCDAACGTQLALDTLRKWLPEEAELRIVEESSQAAPPS